MPPLHLQRLHELRQSFPQPVSDPVHDGYVAFSVLRSLDQVDKLKSSAPILGQPVQLDFETARAATVARKSQPIEDVVPQLVEYLDGMFNWGHPRNQMNVIAPPSLASIIGVLLASMYNPNLCSEESSRRFSEAEVRACAMVADLVGYDTQRSGGVFTSGGTNTILYAARVGLEKAMPGSLRTGLREEAVIIGSDVCHYACYSVSAWLGIGQESFLPVPSQDDNSINLEALEATCREALSSGKKIAMILATMGSTDAFGIDDLKAIVAMRDQLVEDFNLPYHPHVHADSVIGWAWSVFNDYCYNDNVLEFRGRTIRAIAAAQRNIRHLPLADSMGIDFHKTGYVPYVSSAVLFKDKSDLVSLRRNKSTMPYLYTTGECHPGEYTLETSRSATGPMSALASLLLLGKEGLQVLIGHAVDMAEALREQIASQEHLTVLNSENCGPVTLFRAYPSNVDTFTIKKQELHDVHASELVRKHNDLNRKIYDNVIVEAYQGKGVAISLTEGYRKTDSGEPLFALKSYILSPFCDETEVNAVVQQVSAARDVASEEVVVTTE